MYKVTIGREVEMDGHKVGNSMGVNTWAGFAGTADDAVVVGDFAVLENELQTVLKNSSRSEHQYCGDSPTHDRRKPAHDFSSLLRPRKGTCPGSGRQISDQHSTAGR